MAQEARPAESAGSAAVTHVAAGSWAMLAGLVLTLVICNIDRNIIAVLLEPIRHEFQLHDWQLGLLAGLTFTVLYCVGTLLVAGLAERRDRVTIVSVALFAWSAFTFLCGHAATFTQLLLARAGVGLTESGSATPSHALIADRFEGRERSIALGIYASGALIGALVALPLGGILAERWGWRGALWAVSIPGVILAFVLRLVLRDPRTAGSLPPAAPQPGLSAWRDVLANPGILHSIAGATLLNLAAAATLSFGVSVLVRQRGLTGAEAGAVFGFVNGGFAVLGTIGGGWLAARLLSVDHRWRSWLPMLALLLSVPLMAGFLLMPSTALAVLSGGLSSLLLSSWMGPTYAVIQDLAGPTRRATAAACLLVAYNLFGFGLGPFVTGLTSDLLTPAFGPRALGMGLLVLQPFALWGALHFFLASRHLPPPSQEQARVG